MKRFLFVFIFVFISPFFVFGCSNGESGSLNHYEIFVDYDDISHSADCFEKVTYANVSTSAFDSIFFHLYPNAFRENAKTKVVSLSSQEKAYQNGESFGSIQIQDVKIQNRGIDFKIVGEDENILEIPLLQKLYPDEKVEICIYFVLILPNINHRYGYGENTINFGNFYPIACVYEDVNGFKKDLYTSNGDPFYSDIANYDVKVKYDKSFLLASTGEEIEKVETNEEKVSQIEARKVRDFCFVLSSEFKVIEGKANDTLIKYFYFDDQNAEESLEIAIEAVNSFNEMFGLYPYSTLCVVETNFIYGGMEYPNLVMISDAINDKKEYQYAIVHEIAHQWWYGVVGNDEFNEPWLDESLTEYSALLFFEKNDKYGLKYDIMVENANSTYKFFVDVYSKIYNDFDTSMTRPLSEFKTEPEYVNLVYTKGVLMFDSLRSLVGEKKLLTALRDYYKKYAFKNVKGYEFMEIIDKKTGFGPVMESFLDGEVVIK